MHLGARSRTVSVRIWIRAELPLAAPLYQTRVNSHTGGQILNLASQLLSENHMALDIFYESDFSSVCWHRD